MESSNLPQTDKAITLQGIIIYGGTTGAGKTHLARTHFDTLVSGGVNGLIIDSQGVENFADIQHVDNEGAIFPALWRKREEGSRGNIVAWLPNATDEFEDIELVDRVFQVCREVRGKAGPLVVLVDECAFWKHSKQFQMLCRAWRHAKATMLLTTQHLSGDLGQVVYGCNPQIAIFKTTAPRSLDWLSKWHKIEPETAQNIPERDYILRRF